MFMCTANAIFFHAPAMIDFKNRLSKSGRRR
jgi:hypothetical protein